MLQFLIAADDRTGALEVAGLSADAGAGPVLVTSDMSSAPAGTAGVAVVDLGSRHLDASGAAERAGWVDRAWSAAATGHKIDSTLRGNWSYEVLKRSSTTGLRVLVVPAFPGLGRTCVHGVVRAEGVPVADGPAGRDLLSPARSSRPAELLVAAGSEDVDELRDAAGVERWARGTGRVAVCDARTDDDLRAIADRWKPWAGDVLFVGTGAAVSAAVGTVVRTVRAERAPRRCAPVLVVCGSLHPVARAQLEALRTHRPSVEILTTPVPADTRGVDAGMARGIVSMLAAEAHERLREDTFRTVLIIGGDTAAAVLGPEPVLVGGTAAPGVPWLRRLDGSGPLILTRSGGFGDERALVQLLEEEAPT